MTSEGLLALKEARQYSRVQISLLRVELEKILDKNEVGIVVVGSFGRAEASPHSDLDFFLIKRRPEYDPSSDLEKVKNKVTELGIKQPSFDGAFASHIDLSSDILKNIGGFQDTNQKLTRRVLLLLEGTWLHNQALYDELLGALIDQYVRETITEHQLARFFLNDLIRYYRTICVDFEHKTYEDGKSWGDRNIKLMFSRKLLYFSGILVVAETVQHQWSFKRKILADYLRMTPTERVQRICDGQGEVALRLYNKFLEMMSSQDVRDMLKRTTEDRHQHSVEFRNFKNTGHHFTWELSRLLTTTYDSGHPIHTALKF